MNPRSLLSFRARRRASAYMIIEAMVYIGVLFVLLGIGYSALYRCIEQSALLRRNATAISSAMQAGERWRADIRAATGPIQVESSESVRVMRIPGARGEIQYAFADGAVTRRIGDMAWTSLLSDVVDSKMVMDRRERVVAWRWELELRSHARTRQVKPLFSFMAVPATVSSK